LRAIHGPTGLGKLAVAVITIYIPFYLYRAMRRVYEQGRAMTIVKFGLLVVAYFACMLFTLLGLVFYTVLTL
jgi:hypothetical protein